MNVVRKILLLGNGESVIPLALMAKEEGYSIVVIGMDSESIVARNADIFYFGKFTDKDFCLGIACKEAVNGVLGTTELAMTTAAFIAEKMNLPGNDYSGVNILMHKSEFRDLLEKLGMFSPIHISGFEEDAFADKVKTLPFPIIIKPNQSSGSRGVKILMEYDDLNVREAFYLAQSYSSDEIVCAEQYIDAPSRSSFIEFSVFVLDGKMIYFFPMSDTRTKYCCNVPAQCSLPADLSDEQIQIAKNSIENVLLATGTRFGEYDVEGFFTSKNQLLIIEINPRRGGGNIQKYIKEHSGVDLTRLIVQLSVGDRRYFNEIKGRGMLNKYITKQCVFSGKSGYFRKLEIHPEIKCFVVAVHLDIKEGDWVEACRDYQDKIGEVVLRFENREQQLEYYGKIEDFLCVELK